MRLHRFLLASLLAVPLSLTLPFALSGQTNLPAVGNIATFAGTGGYRPIAADAGDGSAAISVSLQTPDGLAFDIDGNLYIADKNDNRIRMVDLGGKIHTVVGNGTPGNTGDGFDATLATLFQPIGVTVVNVNPTRGTVVAKGDLLIVDYGNHRIRKVDHLTGIISAFAGNGTNGYAGDGLPATDPSVELNDPSAVAVDANGDIYIADLSNYRIRKVDHLTGFISTIAGNGTQGFGGDGLLATDPNVKLHSPKALAFDASGNLYIADQYNYRIRKIAKNSGFITTFAGDGTVPSGTYDPAAPIGDGGPATSAQLDGPAGLAFDASGNLYITDQGHLRIRKVDTTGNISTVAGNGTPSPAGGDGPQNLVGDGGPATSAEFSSNAAGLAVSSNYLYIGDFGDDAVRVVNLTAPCSPTLSTNDIEFTASANDGSVNIATSNGCSWTAASDSPWLTLTAATQGTASGPIAFHAEANDTISPRFGHLTIAGQTPQTQTLTVKQSGSACSYTPSALNVGFTATAGDGSVNVATLAGCNWTATSDSPWLTLTAAAQGSASGPVAFHVEANDTFSSRTGHLTIGDQTQTATVTVTQLIGFGPPSAGLRFVPVTPCRVADTRGAEGPLLSSGTTRDFAIPQSTCGIPANAQAYSVNFTVVPVDTLTYITVFPTGQPQPVASTLNSFDGRVKANAAIVSAGTNGAVSVFTTDDTQLIIDINGYFVPGATDPALAFFPLTPCRLVDTRGAVGPLGAPALSAQQERVFPVLTSTCQVPSTAKAYSLNYTVVPKEPLGFLTTFPTGQTRPGVSTLNAPTGTVTANAAIVPAGDNGDVSVFVTNDTELIIDINGYFAPPASGGLSLYNLAPCRVYDSRAQIGAQPVVDSMAVNVVGSGCNAPASAQSYIFNTTAVPTDSLAFLTLWPHGTGERPNASALNAPDGTVTSNMAIVPTTDGSISAFASQSTQLILDIFGYFAP
jgi:sugar lactone lactonase YvrE